MFVVISSTCLSTSAQASSTSDSTVKREQTANLRMYFSLILLGVMWILPASLIFELSFSLMALEPFSLKQTSPIAAGTGSSNLPSVSTSLANCCASSTLEEVLKVVKKAVREPAVEYELEAPQRHTVSSQTKASMNETVGRVEFANVDSQAPEQDTSTILIKEVTWPWCLCLR